MKGRGALTFTCAWNVERRNKDTPPPGHAKTTDLNAQIVQRFLQHQIVPKIPPAGSSLLVPRSLTRRPHVFVRWFITPLARLGYKDLKVTTTQYTAYFGPHPHRSTYGPWEHECPTWKVDEPGNTSSQPSVPINSPKWRGGLVNSFAAPVTDWGDSNSPRGEKEGGGNLIVAV
ncbi:hypothetical protein SODALDRAFT_381567 [Sodiomyces alkalinus F11]|uniref:Uncharacterized protein n=1 Tax=Sodiomyces alkalinus (strain CBS 110278 / VKM F-3762 / F11) TaxID=1314773 RepID=A0A3N2PLJ5_SODAK|nr:hypothetical protein SODALDRAFT_381567 [Sodiomyces alkalinus F11]ROT35405.1 hypothetical protein SODALDRAFT_381567 [Sodiomyces alkalinus F11]